MRVVYIAEIVDKSGLYCVKTGLKNLREKFSPDVVIANGDGVEYGYGLGKVHAIYLHKIGIDIITSGDQIYYKKSMVGYIGHANYMARPHNHYYKNPGTGCRYYSVGDHVVGVINLLGMSGYGVLHLPNPFPMVRTLAEKLREKTPIIIVDFHALVTSEKNVMQYIANGEVSALIGSGSRVQTADARVLSNGTAVICDAGRTGSRKGVVGLNPDIELRKFLSQIHEKSGSCWEDLVIEGVVIDIGEDGKATAIETFRESIESPKNGSNSDSNSHDAERQSSDSPAAARNQSVPHTAQ